MVCCSIGCGPRLVDVSGRVTYNGEPLHKEGGQIIFVGPQGRQVPAPIAENGAYQANGVVAGHNKVVVYYPNTAVPIGKPLPGRLRPGSVLSPLLTPAKYANADTSGLTVEADTGTVFNVEMKGPDIR